MTIKRFFRNYILKSLGLTIAFFFANVLIVVVMIGILSLTRYDQVFDRTIELTEIESSIKGYGIPREQMEKNLKENGSFFFLLDQDGNVIDQYNLPAELNHHYTLAEGISFSRWYLDNYPTFTKVLEDGKILVKGLPSGSAVKYSLSMPVSTVFWDVAFVPLLLLCNLVLFLGIDYVKTRKLSKNLEPILKGVTDLSQGKEVNLPFKGPLKEINGELNKTSKTLLSKEEARVEWISGISHDIRTPLTAIVTANNLIDLRDRDCSELTKRINYNALKIKRLVEGLNLENKLDYGLIPTNPVMTLAAQALSEPIVDFMNENNTPNHSINVSLSQECWNTYITVDPNLLNRLIGNILLNSVVHNPDGVDIDVEAKLIDKKIELTISDNGKGLNAEALRDINERSSLPNFSKHGHGLNLVKKIADALNTDIYFKDSPEKGLSVIIVFQTIENNPALPPQDLA